MIRKLKLLWKLLDSVDRQGDDLVIRLDGNVRFEVDGHMVQNVSKSCLIKTGIESGHLLYLNPVTEQTLNGSVDDSIEQSSMSHKQAMSRLASDRLNRHSCQAPDTPKPNMPK